MSTSATFIRSATHSLENAFPALPIMRTSCTGDYQHTSQRNQTGTQRSLNHDPHEKLIIVADDNFDSVFWELFAVRVNAPLICRIRSCKGNGDDAYFEFKYNCQNYELVREFLVGQSSHPAFVILKLPTLASTIDRSECRKQPRLHIRTQKDCSSTSAHVAPQFLCEKAQRRVSHVLQKILLLIIMEPSFINQKIFNEINKSVKGK